MVLERGRIRVCKAKPCWGLHYLVLKHFSFSTSKSETKENRIESNRLSEMAFFFFFLFYFQFKL